MSNANKTDGSPAGKTENSLDPVSISARLLNLILEMPVDRQLKLLEMLDNGNYNGARKHPRKQLTLPVDLEVERHVFKEATRDISKGGVYIETQTSFSISQEVKLNLKLPHKPEPLAVVGEIVRATSRGIAIKFKRDPKG